MESSQEKPEQEMYAEDVSLGSVPEAKHKKRSSMKIALIAVAVLAVLILGAAKLAKPDTPEDVGNKFMKYLLAGDYGKAYDYMAYTDDVLRTKENFIKSCEAVTKKYPKENAVVDFELKYRPPIMVNSSPENIQNDNSMTYDLIYTFADGSTFTESLGLIRFSDSGKDEWKAFIDLLYDSYILDIPFLTNDMTVSINGEPQRDANEFRGIKGENINFDVFDGFDMSVTLEGDEIKPQTVDFTADDFTGHYETAYVKTIDGYEASEQLEQTAKSVIEAFNKARIEAEDIRSMKPYEPYVVKGSSMWESLEASIDRLVFINTKHELILNDIYFESFKLTGKNTLEVKAVETWSVKRFNSSSGKLQGEQSPNDKTKRYKLERQTNGSWMIVS